jgi:hypothetical protein
MAFDSQDSLRQFVAERSEAYLRYVGGTASCGPEDVVFRLEHHDHLTGWKNVCSVLMQGRIVGYCGE